MYQATQSVFASFWKELSPKDAFSRLWKCFPNWDEKAVIDFLSREGSHKANEVRTILGFSQAVESLSEVVYEQMEEKLRETFLFFCKNGDDFTHWSMAFCPRAEWFESAKSDKDVSKLTADEAFLIFPNGAVFSDRWEYFPYLILKMKPLDAARFVMLVLDFWCGVPIERRSDESANSLNRAISQICEKYFQAIDMESLQRQWTSLCQEHKDDVLAQSYLEKIGALFAKEPV